MSQEMMTPSQSYTLAAEQFYIAAMRMIPEKNRCNHCHFFRWFVFNRYGNKLCAECFRNWISMREIS